jgi:hypothetical protein
MIRGDVVGMVFLIATLLVGCSNGRSEDDGIGVAEDSRPVATLGDQFLAADKASDLAGFRVLPVEALPPDFRVTGINVLGTAGIRRAQVFVSSERGGLMIEQFGEAVAEGSPWQVGGGDGEFFLDRTPDGGARFGVTARGRSFAILSRSDDAISDDEALTILRSLVSRL